MVMSILSGLKATKTDPKPTKSDIETTKNDRLRGGCSGYSIVKELKSFYWRAGPGESKLLVFCMVIEGAKPRSDFLRPLDGENSAAFQNHLERAAYDGGQPYP